MLYVGKSKDIRARVKSYFYGDTRKKIQELLGAVSSVESLECAGELEALVLEARLIQRHDPPYNRHGKGWRRRAYLKLDATEAYPRLKVVHAARCGDGCIYLGPFGSGARARLAKEALEEAVPVRRCTRPMGERIRFAPCALAVMGGCAAPCNGRVDPEHYGELVRILVSSLTRSPEGLLAAVEKRMSALADHERFEEAASARDRLRALAEALWRARQDAWLVRAGRLALICQDGVVLRFDRGSLTGVGDPALVADPLSLPCPRERADELATVRAWLAHHATRIMGCDGIAPSELVDAGTTIARIRAEAKRAS